LQRLTRNEPHLDADVRTFLSRNYDLKSIADYETGPEADVSRERASQAVEEARRFIAHFEKILNAG
jgi:uncharacterized protein (UPF0332 family)